MSAVAYNELITPWAESNGKSDNQLKMVVKKMCETTVWTLGYKSSFNTHLSHFRPWFDIGLQAIHINTLIIN